MSNDERRVRTSNRGSASVRRAGAHSGVNNSPTTSSNRADRSGLRAEAQKKPMHSADKYRQSAEQQERPAVSISNAQRREAVRRSKINKDRTARSINEERAARQATEERSARKVNEERSVHPSGHEKTQSDNRKPAQTHSTKRNKSNTNMPLIGMIVLLILAVCVFFAFKLSKNGSNDETQESINPNAIMHNAVIDLSLITGPSDSVAQVAEEGADETAAADPSMLNIKGMTLDEIKTEINKRYDWSLKVVNDSAEVGAVVKPTVDANETTEAATMGDAENPDSLIEPAALEEEEDEITVSNEIHIVDLVSIGAEELINDIVINENSFREEKASLEAESETAKKKKKKNETETEKEAHIYRLELPEYTSIVDDAVARAELMWYKAPKGGGIGSYDKENDVFVMEGAEDGFQVDAEELRDQLNAAIAAGNYTESLKVPGEVLKTDIKAVEAEYKTIASFSTKTTDNSIRNKNIKIACEMLNGTIVKPGEEFSFNDAVGERTAAKGYGAAAAYNNGEVVQEVGGGVCQLSTTLYNAVLRAGLKTTKRQSHTFKPTYVTPGWDATISWGGPDYRFANVPSREEYSNEKSYAIGIRAHYADNKVTVSIYGRPVLKEGYTYELESKKIKDIDIVRKLIEEGSGRTPTDGSMGSQWTTDLIIKKDGKVVKQEYDHKTYYSGHIQYYLEEPLTESSSETLVPGSSETTTDSVVTGPDGGPGVGMPEAGNPGRPSELIENPVSSHGDDGPSSNNGNNIETFPVRPVNSIIDIG